MERAIIVTMLEHGRVALTVANEDRLSSFTLFLSGRREVLALADKLSDAAKLLPTHEFQL